MPALRPRIPYVALFALALAVFPGVPAGAAVSDVPCEDGFANQYPCSNVDLLAHLPNSATGGGGRANDIWGWTDPDTGREYALVGKSNGTAFVDITEPTSPVYLGLLPTTGSMSTSAGVFSAWRDIKVYEDHAYVVSEEPGHGVQVFDLTRLRGVTEPQEWTIDSLYPLANVAHNIAINEETGYAYAMGGSLPPGVGCSGLHMIDIRIPNAPVPAGCFQTDLYTHDAQCVIYRGPDERYTGSEICLAENEDTLTIVDVTNKALPMQLSRTGYPGAEYTHQGWLTEDHRYFIMGDEGDEGGGVPTTTYIWDVADLTAPELIGIHRGRTMAIDHNLYTKGDLVYQANYRAGLQVYSLETVSEGTLREVASFDIFPASDGPSFNGAWSNYPYFDSGVIVLNGIEQGLFVLRPRIADLGIAVSAAPDPVALGGTLTYTLDVENVGPYDATGVTVTDLLGPGVTFQSASGAPCTYEGGIVTCDVGALAVGETITITVEVTPTQSGELTTRALVSGSEADQIQANDEAEVTTTVTG